MSYGAVILGYSDPAVNKAIIEQLNNGSIYSVDNILRYELAQLIQDWFPSAEKIAFYKTGSEATQASVRIARYVTGRSIILHNGYHGWYDWCSDNKGVPADVTNLLYEFEYNDLDNVEQLLKAQHGRVAAIILQPGGDHKTPADGFMSGLKELCRQNEALLIFDEVRTGLRMGRGGAQEFFGVKPDLTCISKGLGNGLPISAVFGPGEYMDYNLPAGVEGTYQRDVLSFAAAVATLKEMNKRSTINHIWETGALLMDRLRAIFERYDDLNISLNGYPPMPRIKFNEDDIDYKKRKQLFYERLFANGIMLPPRHHLFLADAHGSGEVDALLDKVEDACKYVSKRM